MTSATPQSTSEAPASFNQITVTELADVVNPSGNPVSLIPDGATLSFNASMKKWVVSNSL